MTRKTPVSRALEVPGLKEDDLSVENQLDQVMVRPDGYYWQAADGKQEFGPFKTVELALADMASGDDDEEPVPGETLQEAENEIGISDWIDPETGQPAQGQSPPRLDEE